MRVFLTIILITLCIYSYSQRMDVVPEVDKLYAPIGPGETHPAVKVMAITGAAAFSTGLILLVSSLNFTSNDPDDLKRQNTGETLMWIGGSLFVLSIPLHFVLRNEAGEIQLGCNKLNYPGLNMSYSSQFAVKISIGK